MTISTTDPTAGPPATPSTEERREGTSRLVARDGVITRQSKVMVGDTVLVLLAEGVRRPLIISGLGIREVGRPTDLHPQRELRVSGTLFCEPEDALQGVIRQSDLGTSDPTRFHGRPDRQQPWVYAEHLAEGGGIGQWQPRPTGLPARS